MSGFTLFNALEWIIIIYFTGINSTYLLLLFCALAQIRNQKYLQELTVASGLFKSDLYKTVSILVPAYNEAENIVESIESLLKLEYPQYEIIVINDGSRDHTLHQLIKHFKLEKKEVYYEKTVEHQPVKHIYTSPVIDALTVIDKENGGKADALNAGLNLSEYDLVFSIDADSILEQDSLRKFIQPFIEHKNTIAAGGVVRVINGCKIENREIKEIHIPKNHWARLQSVEYLRAFLFGRVGWDYLKSLMIISGAFGIFDRKAVLEVGGYLTDTVGEDIELIFRLHSYNLRKKRNYNIRFLSQSICWTEVPEDYKSLRNQRNRWHRGLADAIWRHKNMLFNPRYRHIGLFVLPFFLFFELLGPVLLIISYVYIFVFFFVTNAISISFIVLFFMVSILYGMIISLTSVLSEEISFNTYSDYKDIFMLTAYSFVENLGYRQIHSWWQVRGLYDFFKGSKSWGNMVRKGFEKQV